jgi:hypothetical protein
MPMPVHMPAMDDVVEVSAKEWRDDVSAIVSIPGRYMLANRRNLKGERCQFACRVVRVSLTDVVLAAPVPGQLGERVIVYTEPFGRLHGAITRLTIEGFVISLAATAQTIEKIGAKLAWLGKQKDAPELLDRRRHARILPRNPSATILTADGSTRSCLVIDFSDTGAAVSADLYPEIGTTLAVGKMIGRVVRRFTEGFAIEFIGQQNLSDVERKLASTDLVGLKVPIDNRRSV